jgi:Flp pilus assembly protein TadG
MILRRIRDCRSGTAAMEFVIVFPVMMLIYGGIVELNNYNSTYLKVAETAYELEDLVGRQYKVDNTGSAANGETSMSLICAMAQPIMNPLPVSSLTITIYDVTYSTTTTSYSVLWKDTSTYSSTSTPQLSCSKSGSAGTYTLPATITGAPGATAIDHLVVVVNYTYTPLLSASLRTYIGLGFSTTMGYTFYGVPRYVVTIPNGGTS